MPFVTPSFLILSLSIASVALQINAATYTLSDTFIGESFLDNFNWETFNDPSGGFVNYVDQATALSTNLTYAGGNSFVIRADDKSVVPNGGRGRDSIRITSHKQYSDSAVVLDINHMPGGCGQWPAIWSMDTGKSWPDGGEVDIIEGVNTMHRNQASLHTTPGCTMNPSRQMKGSTNNKNDCNTRADGNAGCQASFTDGSYGDSFNNQDGGYFVATRNNQDGISMYFWNRNDPTVPFEVVSGAGSLTPNQGWGEPQGYWPTDQCNFSEHFSSHNLIINLSFCGPWADVFYSSMGCGSSSNGACEGYVANNPGDFSNAYFDINSVRVYTM